MVYSFLRVMQDIYIYIYIITINRMSFKNLGLRVLEVFGPWVAEAKSLSTCQCRGPLELGLT